MIHTNTFLSIGFALVARFADVVYVPHHAVPQGTNDLEKYMVGAPPIRRLDLYLVDRRGTQFWIEDGAVRRFRTPDSHQSPGYASNWLPDPLRASPLSSNQVVQLAVSTLGRLAKNGDPLVNRPLSMQEEEHLQGRPSPFYLLRWLDTNNVFGAVAEVEVDARRGEITYLDLTCTNFFDYAFAEQVRKRCYTLDKPRAATVDRRPTNTRRWGPLPTTNQVAVVISNWHEVCNRLDIHPRTDWTPADVDWALTTMVTNHPTFNRRTVCEVMLKDGGEILAMDGRVFVWAAGDQCYGRPQSRSGAEWQPFVGRIVWDWRVEFDMRNGEIKMFNFLRNEKFMDLFLHAQAKSE